MLNFSDIWNKPIAGFEVMIDTQFEDPILEFIGNVFKDMKDTKGVKDKKYIELSKKLAKGLTDRFGIPMKISHTYQMFACMPIDQYDNVLITEMNDHKMGGKATLKKINEFKSREITVDLKRAYIGGLDGVYDTKLYLDHDLIVSNKLTIDELVAIQVHEIGHAFTYIYHSNKIVKNNVTLLESFIYTKDGMDSKANKILINHSKVKGDNSIIIKAMTESNVKSMKEIGNTILGHKNNKDSENEADAFAVRFGVGDNLATALDKLLSRWSNIKRILQISLIIGLYQSLYILLILLFTGAPTAAALLISSITFGVASLAMVYAFITFVPIITLIGTLIIEISGLGDDMFAYPKLEDRIKRMKIELIKILRSNKLDKEDRVYLISKIDNMVETINKIGNSKYSNILAAMPLDSFNYGKDINIDKVYNNVMNELQNNDLHYLAEKANPDNVVSGNESGEEDYKYYTSYIMWSNSYLASVLKDNKDSVDKLNETLVKYGIKISRTEDELEYVIQSNELYRIKEGITSIALVPVGKKEDVISISVDWFKTLYHLKNKYIDVKSVDKVNIKKEYCIYILKEKQYDFVKSTAKDKNIDKLSEYMGKTFRDYGELPIAEELSMLLTYIKNDKLKLPKEVKEQLTLLLEMVNEYELTGTDGFDLHNGNFAYDGSRIIIMDAIFSRKAIALKLNNCVELPSIK